MGREIRRVPPNWQHPKDKRGNYIPLYDQDYDSAAKEWLQEFKDWEADKDGERSRVFETYGNRYYWDWNGMPPDLDSYRQKWETEPTHYQIYETVSEGTPTSPVFASLDEMKSWLLEQGYSEHAASAFIEYEWAPSMIFSSDRGVSGIGIHSLDFLPDKE